MGKKDNYIEIKGIVRNTKDSAVKDGECEEMMGMRLKDGSWRPVGELKRVEGSERMNLYNVSRIWIHRNRYAHVVGLRGGDLVWMGEMVDGAVAAFANETVIDNVGTVDAAKVVVTQTGHLMVMKSDVGMRYYMFRTESNAYERVLVDFNSVKDFGLLPYGAIDFKVERVEDEDGRAVWFGNKIEEAGIVAAEAEDSAKELEVMRTVMEKTKASVKRLGYFTGAMMVCTAAELDDGTYILMSKPTLLGAPNMVAMDAMGAWNKDMLTSPHSGMADGYGNMVWQTNTDYADTYVVIDPGGTGTGTGQTVLNDVRAGQMALMSWMHSKRSGACYGSAGRYVMAARNGRKEYRYDKELFKDDSDFSAYSMDTWSVMNHQDFNGRVTERDGASNTTARSYLKNLRPLVEMRLEGDLKDDTTFCYTCANKLYYKVNNLLSKEYRDIVCRIVVFATRETDMLNMDYDVRIDSLIENPTALKSDQREILSYQPQYRDYDKIVKELMSESMFYKIGEIDVNLAKSETEKWVELNIDEGVLENLVSQDRLKVDSVGRNSYKPEVAFPYNGRLHLANYEERLFEGWLMRDLFHWGGSGQYGYTERSLPVWSNEDVCGWIKVKLEDSEAERVVVRQVTLKMVNGGIQMGRNYVPGVKLATVSAKVQSLGPMLSYPDRRAKEIEIYLRDKSVAVVGANNVFHRKFSLKAHDWFEFAYYIEDDFKPIDIVMNEYLAAGTAIVMPEEKNVSEVKPNQMKVSRVDNPLFFPNENVYKIGNGEIRALAANAETLVGGQLGDAPLYVMCSDGTYGMFVDTTGQFAYTNSRIISRYVCNNALGVAAIHGGVVMPTEWGLVLLNGLDARDASDMVEGKVMDIASEMGDAYKCMNHDRLVRLTGMLDTEGFVDVLKRAKIGYSFYEKELWVVIPVSGTGGNGGGLPAGDTAGTGAGYAYVLCESGDWTKRDVRGVFVEDFPNLYILNGDELSWRDLQREDKARGMQTMWMTRRLKADSQEFKQTERMIVRGEFKVAKEEDMIETLDFRNMMAEVNYEKLWVENPTVETLAMRGVTQMIHGEEVYDKDISVVNMSAIVDLDGTGMPDWSDLRNSLSGMTWMQVGSFLRTDWTAVPSADANYPMFRFDGSGKAWVKFGSNAAFKSIAWVSGVTIVMHFPNGWEGKEEELLEIVSGSVRDVTVHYKYGNTRGGLYLFESNGTTIGSQEDVSNVANKTNCRIAYVDKVGSANISSIVTGWFSGTTVAAYHCFDMLRDINNKINNWSAAKKNNNVTLAAGNVMSDDGLKFSVTAAQAGTNPYYKIEACVKDGGYGKFQIGLMTYTLENGRYYRLGANGVAFEFSGGGSWTWSQLVGKVANGDYTIIETASGSDTVALVQGGCYWIKLTNIGGQSVDVKKAYIGTSGAQSLSWIMSNVGNTSYFVDVTNDRMDVSGKVKVTLESGKVYRFKWGTTDEKVVRIVTGGTQSVSYWLGVVAGLPEYVFAEEDNLIGLYLFGSYDGQKWKLMGGRERGAEKVRSVDGGEVRSFRDLGLIAHRVDCKYFRLMMVGRLMDGSSVEYVEQLIDDGMYRGKIR